MQKHKGYFIFLLLSIIILSYSVTPGKALAFDYSESFSYADNTSPAPNWTESHSIYDTSQNKFVSVNSILNTDNTQADWVVINGRYQIHITPQPVLTAVRAIPINLSSNLKDYSIEFDMDMLNGLNMDRSLAFRFTNDNTHYVVHTYGNNVFLGKIVNGIGEDNDISPNSGSFNFSNQETHHFKIDLLGNKITVFIDGNKIFDSTDNGTPISSGKIALNAAVGSGSGGDVWFDNITVTNLDDTQTNLNVPLLKQTSSPWNTDVYDSANIWSPNDKTISSWGCALTSAVMVFQYHGLIKMPDGIALDPGSVNTWMKKQPDGYVNGGNVNWIALSRLSKLAKASGNNPTALLDALEYTRYDNSTTQLTTDLTNTIPDIIEEPGHFIVGTGISGNTFSIQDPYYNRNLLTDSYGNTFLSLGHYSPSHTDLSYLMFSTDQNTQINVQDKNLITVGQSFIQSPLIDDANPLLKSGSPITMYYLQKPDDGDYKITLTGGTTHAYTLQEFTYDLNGNPIIATQSGVVSQGHPETFSIHSDKTHSANDKTKKTVTYQTVIDDINEGIALKQLNNTLGKSLIALVQSAEKDNTSGKKSSEQIKLNAILVVLATSKGPLLSDSLYQILKQDVNSLLGK